MKRFVLIGSRKLGTSIDLVNRSIDRRYKVTVVVDPREDFSGVFPEQVELVQILPIFDDVFSWFSRRFTITDEMVRVATAYGPYAHIAAKICEAFALPGPKPQTLEQMFTKPDQRKFLSENNFPTVRFTAIDSATRQRLGNEVQHLSFPVVVKPIQGTGAFGVQLCSDMVEIKSYFDQAEESSEFIIEEFISGEEYCVELFDGRFVGALRKLRLDYGKFAELGYTSELSIDASTLKKLVETVEAVCQTSGLVWGPVHLDVIVAHGTTYVIDINPRLAGSYITEMVSDSYNFDIISALLDKLESINVLIPDNIYPKSYCRFDFILKSDPSSWIVNHKGSFKDASFHVRYGPMVVPNRDRVSYVYIKQA